MSGACVQLARALTRWAAAGAAILALAPLAGCAGAPRLPERVLVPVPVGCDVPRPVRPPLATDADLRALTDYQLPLALALDRRVRQQYQAQLEAVVEGCWISDRGGT